MKNSTHQSQQKTVLGMGRCWLLAGYRIRISEV